MFEIDGMLMCGECWTIDGYGTFSRSVDLFGVLIYLMLENWFGFDTSRDLLFFFPVLFLKEEGRE